MESHDANITTPIQDSISETIRGVTEHNESVSSKQLYLSEAFMPNEGGVDTEANIRDLPVGEE